MENENHNCNGTEAVPVSKKDTCWEGPPKWMKILLAPWKLFTGDKPEPDEPKEPPNLIH